MVTWSLESRCVQAQVQSLGGMLGPAYFRLEDRQVQPFAIAPWANDISAEHQRLPKLLQRLRGEWPCVPYGIERNPRDLPEAWRSRESLVLPFESVPHGPSSNLEWRLIEQKPDFLQIAVDYPPTHPVKSLTRTIRASQTTPTLELTLEVAARAECVLPIGLHPTFSLPEAPHQARVKFCTGARAWTPPVPLEPGIACFELDCRNVPLQSIPMLTGSTEDVTHLPLAYPAEELILVVGHKGSAKLIRPDERYAVDLRWDPSVFPACQLWLSNKGRTEYPWNRRFLALGIEPICAAFDLGMAVSRNLQNPLWQAGVHCAVEFSPSRPFQTSYQIALTSH